MSEYTGYLNNGVSDLEFPNISNLKESQELFLGGIIKLFFESGGISYVITKINDSENNKLRIYDLSNKLLKNTIYCPFEILDCDSDLIYWESEDQSVTKIYLIGRESINNSSEIISLGGNPSVDNIFNYNLYQLDVQDAIDESINSQLLWNIYFNSSNPITTIKTIGSNWYLGNLRHDEILHISIGAQSSEDDLNKSNIYVNVAHGNNKSSHYRKISCFVIENHQENMAMLKSFSETILVTKEIKYEFFENHQFDFENQCAIIGPIATGSSSCGIFKCDFSSQTISEIVSFNSAIIPDLSNFLIVNNVFYFCSNNYTLFGELWSNPDYFSAAIYGFSLDGIFLKNFIIENISGKVKQDLENEQSHYNFRGNIGELSCFQIIHKNGFIYAISNTNLIQSKLKNDQNAFFEKNDTIGGRLLAKYTLDGGKIFSKIYFDIPNTKSRGVFRELYSKQNAVFAENGIYLIANRPIQKGWNNFGSCRTTEIEFEYSGEERTFINSQRTADLIQIDPIDGEILNSFNIGNLYSHRGTNPYPFFPAIFGNNDLISFSAYVNVPTGGVTITSYMFISSSSGTDNSSSSSSESNDLENSSSSSLNDKDYIPSENAQKIWGILLKQGHHNLLPFTFATSSNITSLDLTEAEASQIIIPDKLEDLMTHRSDIYLDIMTENAEGVKDIYLSNSSEINKSNQLGSYQIPKFVWSNSLFVKTSEVERQNVIYPNSCWITSSDGLYKFEFNDTETKQTFAQTISSPIKSIWAPKTSRILTTSQDYLYSHEMNHSINQWDQYELEFNEYNKKYNANRDLILFQNQSLTFTSQGKEGKIIQRNNDTLEIEATFTGLDSVFKILYSIYHDAYILIGDNFIWKLKNNTPEIIFSIEDVTFKDAAIDSNGNLALIFSLNSQDYLRIIANDFYKIKLNKNYSLNSLKYVLATENEFVALQTTSAGIAVYNFLIWNIKTKDFTEKSFIPKTELSRSSVAIISTNQPIEVTYPNENIISNKAIDIKWLSNKSVNDLVKIQLLDAEQEIAQIISENTLNTGSFSWTPSNLNLDENYTIKITWLAAEENSANSDESIPFAIIDEADDTNSSDVAGMDWDKRTNNVVLITENGYLGYLDLNNKDFTGLISTDISNVNSILAINERIYMSDNQVKVRVFVGSQEYISDMWDSGIIAGDLTSMYYGGGNNLIPGEKYYVHIQIYTPEWGWSKVQKNNFIMPR